MKKKRLLTMLLALVALVAMLIVPANAYGVWGDIEGIDYPAVAIHTGYDETVLQGETVTMEFEITRAWVSEKLHVNIYSGNTVDSTACISENVYSLEGTFHNPVKKSVTINTSKMAAGTYTVEYYMEYSKRHEWLTAPERHTTSLTVLNNPCANGHTWGEPVVTTPSTCTEHGVQIYTCSTCGKTWEEEAPLADHTWGEWTVVSAATPNYPGSQTHTCTVCGTEETVEIPATGNLFTDVHEGDYFYASVLWAADHGITTGKSATRFAPADTCTRAQVVTFLWRAAGSREPQTTENPFTDVAEGSYYYKAVLWGYENGIVKGTSDTTFEPDKVINREQAVTFIWRCYGSPDPQNASCPFADVGSNYAYNAILWAVEQNVTQGTSATTFAPKNSCTRGQIVTFLYRAMH